MSDEAKPSMRITDRRTHVRMNHREASAWDEVAYAERRYKRAEKAFQAARGGHRDSVFAASTRLAHAAADLRDCRARAFAVTRETLGEEGVRHRLQMYLLSVTEEVSQLYGELALAVSRRVEQDGHPAAVEVAPPGPVSEPGLEPVVLPGRANLRRARRQRQSQLVVLCGAAVLLPAESRARWSGEWRGDLGTLVSRQDRWRYTWSQLCGMPRLAYTLHRPIPRWAKWRP